MRNLGPLRLGFAISSCIIPQLDWHFVRIMTLQCRKIWKTLLIKLHPKEKGSISMIVKAPTICPHILKVY